MTSHRPTSLLLAAVLLAAATPARAQQLPSGWSVAPVEAPLGESRACAATKMTGADRGIGFTRLSSGLELLTVAVEGWAYPLGAAVPETMAIGAGTPVALKALGQDDALVASGKFSTDKALRAASALDIVVADKHRSFDIGGLDQAFVALDACVTGKS